MLPVPKLHGACGAQVRKQSEEILEVFVIKDVRSSDCDK